MNEKEFIAVRIEQLKQSMRYFPIDFITEVDTELLEMPRCNLLMAPPLFDTFELVDEKGNVHFHTDNVYKAKYIIYANSKKPNTIVIPKNTDEIELAVKQYEAYLDSLLREIERDYKKEFPESKNHAAVTNRIFNSLNLIRL
ncbi:hypothetical protein ACSSWA_09910 [Melioribacter sp. Ez-97]|uniref:hypothetical protein n=1 Tax=Melioribacter sp. Ez-97 TaxID=3423434 RepID=UPI003EDA081C